MADMRFVDMAAAITEYGVGMELGVVRTGLLMLCVSAHHHNGQLGADKSLNGSVTWLGRLWGTGRAATVRWKRLLEERGYVTVVRDYAHRLVVNESLVVSEGLRRGAPDWLFRWHEGEVVALSEGDDGGRQGQTGSQIEPLSGSQDELVRKSNQFANRTKTGSQIEPEVVRKSNSLLLTPNPKKEQRETTTDRNRNTEQKPEIGEATIPEPLVATEVIRLAREALREANGALVVWAGDGQLAHDLARFVGERVSKERYGELAAGLVDLVEREYGERPFTSLRHRERQIRNYVSGFVTPERVDGQGVTPTHESVSGGRRVLSDRSAQFATLKRCIAEIDPYSTVWEMTRLVDVVAEIHRYGVLEFLLSDEKAMAWCSVACCKKWWRKDDSDEVAADLVREGRGLLMDAGLLPESAVDFLRRKLGTPKSGALVLFVRQLRDWGRLDVLTAEGKQFLAGWLEEGVRGTLSAKTATEFLPIVDKVLERVEKEVTSCQLPVTR